MLCTQILRMIQTVSFQSRIITRGSCPGEFTLCVATNLRSGPNPPAQKRRDLAVVGLRCNICNGKKEVDGDMVDKWW